MSIISYVISPDLKSKVGKQKWDYRSSFLSLNLNAIEQYKKCWQIETVFRTLKSSGFNIKDTHLMDIKHIEKLLAIVLIAFLWTYIIGIYIHQKIRQIRILKHGNREKSLFKYGLEYIAKMLLNPYKTEKIKIDHFLSCT